MIFRQARPDEIEFILQEGYKQWSKNRTLAQYCTDNGKEDAFGTRYVIDADGEVVSSLILLRLGELDGLKVFGIGSVLTSENHYGKGYASELLKYCFQQVDWEKSVILLYSDISPDFYKRFGFRILPSHLQKCEKSICMAKCTDDNWNKLTVCPAQSIPSYF